MSNNKKSIAELCGVGENIQRALDKRGKTQVWLAEEMTKVATRRGDENANFDRAQINTWCKNRHIPRMPNMKIIADVLDYSVEEIVTGNFKDEKFKNNIDMSDPVISGELNQILEYIDNACRQKELSDAQVNRYKKLIESKVITLIKYAC